jgi:hypothetical protein
MNALNFALLTLPLWIPGIVGLYLVITRPNDLSLMAGLLTLKPIATTPIWMALLAYFDRSTGNKMGLSYFYAILPGAGLTLVAAILFRHLFSGPGAGSALTLLALDCARWLNSFLMSASGSNPRAGSLACVFALIGLALPTVFAVVALTTSLSTARESVP